MNRFQKYLRRRLARLALPKRCARGLLSCIRDASRIQCSADEALRCFKAQSAYIQALVGQMEGETGVFLPAIHGKVRILRLAHSMISGGENRLDVCRLLDAVRTFERSEGMTMQEIQRIPAALRIALCQALDRLGREILRSCVQRKRAERWVRGGCRACCGRKTDFFFLQHAIQLCCDLERPELYARVMRLVERRNANMEHIDQYVHAIQAQRCLRLDNLMHLRRILEHLDWEECFTAISTADMELNHDPSGVYGSMEASSKACVRECTAELAERFDLAESAVARCALRAAGKALRENGVHDPRATVCWYLAEDAGRAELARQLGFKGRLFRCIADPSGQKSLVLMLCTVVLVAVLLLCALGTPLLWIYVLPLAWGGAMQLIARFYARRVKPGRLLKLKLEAIPDSARTLVVLPVLLSSAARAEEILAHMDALGCLERDANIDFLLLGDFRDADAAVLEEDAEILRVVREGMAALNRSAGRKKYYYLHRARSHRAQDAKWMGENRKRGALMALNALLLKHPQAEAAFQAEGECAPQLAGKYRYVVTLDADTEYLPGTLHRLIGTMLHPLNRACILRGHRRGYAVLQPNMQMMAEACTNDYVEITAGCGGLESYPICVSNFYQDMTGHGCFAGKGLYDVEAFDRATRGQLPDDVILSHDLIEGILAGAGFINDLHFYDAVPENLPDELQRLHRWTRGDWQLLPVIFSHMRISALDRMKMIGNLLRSLYAPALLGLLLHSAWLDVPGAFCAALLLAFLEPLLFGGVRMWRRTLFQLAILPCEAACRLDAIGRTLWRLAVSRRHLMDWVPAADANAKERNIRVSGRAAALLMLPGMLRTFWIPAVLALAMLFWMGADWAADLTRRRSDTRETFSGVQRTFLHELARRTWHFFAVFVPEDGCGLPPDNVQLDPNRGIAQRTSPTNIGLYMMSCFSAHALGLLPESELKCRLFQTIETLEKLEKWNGQLYNWYDLTSLAPMKPEYVSAVDSGNLAGALLLCAQMAQEVDTQLSIRMRNLVQQMNLAALYDAQRELFRIGVDTVSGQLSQSHYDLYASESRILSYAAMMLGQIPVKHWERLSRACVRIDDGQSLLSWSGTMFEYLMPELLLRSHENTLAGRSRRGTVACQMAFGRAQDRPWGVSESGYYAFDRDLNYQYRAFGLPDLALSGSAMPDVVAPYAAALALVEAPVEAAENLRRMAGMGWMGEYGMFEAADYMHMDAQHAPRIVRSHMAHHQGMALCAICNALCDNVLSNSFMQIPQARALRLLLQERMGKKARPRRSIARAAEEQGKVISNFARNARSNVLVDAQLLQGGGTTALVTAKGAAFAWRGDWQLNRFSGKMCSRQEGMYVHARDLRSGRSVVLGRNAHVRFDAGFVTFREEFEGLKIEMTLAVSPEDGTLYQTLQLQNSDRVDRALELTGCMAVAHGMRRDMQAHPIFQHLFVRSDRIGENALIFRRKRRDPGEALPELIYLISGEKCTEMESDMEKLIGRTGGLGLQNGIARHLTGSVGNVLNPCAALRTVVQLKGVEKETIHFALALAEVGTAEDCAVRIARSDAPGRALQLCSMQLRSMLGHAGVNADSFRLFQRCCVLILDAALRKESRGGGEACVPMDRSRLWPAGISGDRAILLVEIHRETGLDCVRSALRMHAFYRMMGVELDFVLLNHQNGDYFQPLRNKLSDLIVSSHLNGHFQTPGGVWLLDVETLSKESLQAMRRAAALHLIAEQDFQLQLRGFLDALRLTGKTAYLPMEARELSAPMELEFFNGYGGVDAGRYVIWLRRDVLPPAPWSNVLASEQAGAVITERGGGFAWVENSRSGRLTAFANDSLHEGWGWMFYLLDEGEKRWIRLLPGDDLMSDFYVAHMPGETCFQSAAGCMAFEVKLHAQEAGLRMDVRLKNEDKNVRHLRLAACVDWLMGTDVEDLTMLRTWSRFGACFASGAAEAVGCFLSDDPRARPGCSLLKLFEKGDMMAPQRFENLDRVQDGSTLMLSVSLRPGEERICRFLLGGAKDIEAAYALAREFRSGEALRRNQENWEERLERFKIETPNRALNFLSNGFLQAQALNARIRGRTGLYQPGGAFGFRDQLQDMLLMLHYEPKRVRRHLLYCAARQFEAGDVLHWWHDPYTGVRTHISDDLLFLPYVAAQYVRVTGDASVLEDHVPYLQDVKIPPEREDVYAPMQPTSHCETLHQHCMRAFRWAADTGEHGLCRMGSGDWNDGMNRVGAQGRGESIWLSEFLAACAADYASIAPNEADRNWLLSLQKRLCEAIERWGWDGEWYLRAYTDAGEKLGGRNSTCCRIDLISQAWAPLAGLDDKRCRSALNAAWEQLSDPEHQLIRLLTPPFDGQGFDPGYIAAYPPGVRENGGQYTHAACWMLCALCRMGDAKRAHAALEMLLPLNHADTRENADHYRVEPYVMAGDVYAQGELAGRGGWSWYTGSGAWMFLAILRLLGYERRRNRVRLNALLNEWPQVRVSLRYGLSSYTLICKQDVQNVTLDGMPVEGEFIEMVDDGREHCALFPPRKTQSELS